MPSWSSESPLVKPIREAMGARRKARLELTFLALNHLAAITIVLRKMELPVNFICG